MDPNQKTFISIAPDIRIYRLQAYFTGSGAYPCKERSLYVGLEVSEELFYAPSGPTSSTVSKPRSTPNHCKHWGHLRSTAQKDLYYPRDPEYRYTTSPRIDIQNFQTDYNGKVLPHRGAPVASKHSQTYIK